jgi:hypothetical protein
MKSIKFYFIVISLMLVFSPVVFAQDKDKDEEENDSMNVETQEVVITAI